VNGVYRLLAVIIAVLVIAIASFNQSLALLIGRTGLIAGLGVLVLIVAGAFIAVFRRKTAPPVKPSDISVARGVDVTPL
jgi:hypothetical protein